MRDSAKRRSPSGQKPAPFPVRWPREYRRLAEGLGAASPLLRMGTPLPSEGRRDPDDLGDPTGEALLRPLPWVVRKHTNRAVILASSRCFHYCRFCFRRGSLTEDRHPAPDEWDAILGWIAGQPELEEVILSGGDPLTLPDHRLAEVGRALSEIPHLQRWRIHTRAPVVLPGRVTPALLGALRTSLPLRLVLHVNHPAEVRPLFLGAVESFQEEGIELLSQSVLLAGVNDAGRILAELFEKLRGAGVRPYYLHHPDRAPGNARFRVPLGRGLRIYGELSPSAGREGVAPPPYVVDLPNGAGKARVAELVPVGEERIRKARRVRYRWVRPTGWDSAVRDARFEWWDIWETPAGPDGSRGVLPGDVSRPGPTR